MKSNGILQANRRFGRAEGGDTVDDLISRAYVLAEYDRQHKGPPGGARRIVEDAPAVDAIPVEWIFEQTKDNYDYSGTIARGLISEWRKEQEAR